MGCLFSECHKLKEIKGIDKFNTSKVKGMRGMFNNCSSLKKIEFFSFNTSKIISTISMFQDCKELEYLDLSNFNTSNVIDMEYMFKGCYK